MLTTVEPSKYKLVNLEQLIKALSAIAEHAAKYRVVNEEQVQKLWYVSSVTLDNINKDNFGQAAKALSARVVNFGANKLEKADRSKKADSPTARHIGKLIDAKADALVKA